MIPFDEGWKAYHECEELSDCPYPGDTRDAVEWEGGFMAAEEDDHDEEQE